MLTEYTMDQSVLRNGAFFPKLIFIRIYPFTPRVAVAFFIRHLNYKKKQIALSFWYHETFFITIPIL